MSQSDQNTKNKQGKQALSQEAEYDALRQKHESDLSEAEKRRLLILTLSRLHGRAKLSYLWSYYKIVPLVLLFLVFLLYFGLSIVHGLRTDTLLSMSVIDANELEQKGSSRLEEELLSTLEKAGLTDGVLSIDLSARSAGALNMMDSDASPSASALSAQDGITSSIKLSMVLSQDANDLIVCNKDVYLHYSPKEIFGDFRNLLGKDAARYAAYLTEDGMLDLSKSAVWEQLGLTSYTPALLCPLRNMQHPEAVRAALTYFFSETAV